MLPALKLFCGPQTKSRRLAGLQEVEGRLPPLLVEVRDYEGRFIRYHSIPDPREKYCEQFTSLADDSYAVPVDRK